MPGGALRRRAYRRRLVSPQLLQRAGRSVLRNGGSEDSTPLDPRWAVSPETRRVCVGTGRLWTRARSSRASRTREAIPAGRVRSLDRLLQVGDLEHELVDAGDGAPAQLGAPPGSAASGLGDLFPADEDHRRNEPAAQMNAAHPEAPLEAARERLLRVSSARQQRVRVRERNGRDDRGPDRATDLLRRVDQSGGEPGLLGGPRRGRDRDRDVRERDPDPDRDEAGQEIDRIGAVGVICVYQRQPATSRLMPVTSTGLAPILVVSACDGPP